MKKRILSAMVAMAAAVAPFASVNTFSVSAIGDTVSLSAPSFGVAPGETFNLPISLDVNPGIVSIKIMVDFDDSKLKLVGASDAKLFSAASYTTSPIGTNPFGILWEDGVAYENYYETGELVTLTFKATEVALDGLTSADINITVSDTMNVDLDDIPSENYKTSVDIIPMVVTTTTQPVTTATTIPWTTVTTSTTAAPTTTSTTTTTTTATTSTTTEPTTTSTTTTTTTATTSTTTATTTTTTEPTTTSTTTTTATTSTTTEPTTTSTTTTTATTSTTTTEPTTTSTTTTTATTSTTTAEPTTTSTTTTTATTSTTTAEPTTTTTTEATTTTEEPTTTTTTTGVAPSTTTTTGEPDVEEGTTTEAPETEETTTTTNVTTLADHDCTTTSATETSEPEVTTSPVDEDSFIAPTNTLARWAANDYEKRTGIGADVAAAELNEDGTLTIDLIDKNGNKLATYVVDPETGIGRIADGAAVNLPQTGRNSKLPVAAGASAVVLVMAGAYISRKSRKNED